MYLSTFYLCFVPALATGYTFQRNFKIEPWNLANELCWLYNFYVTCLWYPGVSKWPGLRLIIQAPASGMESPARRVGLFL